MTGEAASVAQTTVRSDADAARSGISSLGRHSLVFMLGTMLSKLTSFIMLPIYTRHLTPADYGVLELLQMSIDVVGMLAGMSIASAVFRFYPDQDSEADRRKLVSTASVGIAGLAAVSGIIGLAASGPLAALVLPGVPAAHYFRIFFIIYILNAVEHVPLLYLRAQNRSVSVVAVNLVKLIAMLSLNIYFVVHLRMGVAGVLYSNLIASGMTAIVLSTHLFRRVGIGFAAGKFGTMARYGYPLAVGAGANFFLVFSDRFFLNYYGTTADVGIYALAYKFAFVLSAFAFTPFMMAWSPQRFVVARQPEGRDIFRRVFLYVNLLLGGMGLTIALVAPDMLRLMADHAFLRASNFVPLILSAQIIHHWTAFHSFGLQAGLRTGRYAVVSVGAIAVVLILNLALIPRFGIAGAAWATLLAYTVRFLVIYILSQRVYSVSYDWWSIARLYAIIGSAVGARALIGTLPLVSSSAATAAILVVSGTLAFRLVLPQRDRVAVVQLVTTAARSPGHFLRRAFPA